MGTWASKIFEPLNTLAPKAKYRLVDGPGAIDLATSQLVPSRRALTTIHFREPCGPSRSRVQLLGETSDWLNPVPMTRVQGDPGAWQSVLELPAGVYAIKFRADGEWMLDADAPRTRSTWGRRNQIISVGGTPEPVLFAPASPWVFVDSDGALVVTAALRKGAGSILRLLWGERSELDHSTSMRRLYEEDEHVLWRARVPASAARTLVAFELDARRVVGRLEGGPFELVRSAHRTELPDWWRDAVLYTVFVDRFRPEVDRPDWCRPLGPDEPAGGHLDGLRRSLGELRDLGVTVLYLTPVHIGANCHRYDLVDPLRVDPKLGGEEAFARLIEEAHGRGMRVLLDLSFCHAGRGFPPFEDVLLRGRESPFASWFQWHGDPPKLRLYGRREDAPLLDLDQPDVRELAERTSEKWARAGVDGFRLDAAAEVPWALARSMRERLRASRPDSLVLGEVVPAHAWRWKQEEAVDVSTDFTFHALAGDWIATRTIDAAHAARRLLEAEFYRGGEACTSARFLSTHDHVRFATLARMHGGASRVALGLLLLAGSPGVPALLYGEEIGLWATILELEPESVWQDRAPMPWTEESRDLGLRALVRRLLAARAASRALRHGSVSIEYADGPLMVLRRAAGGEVVDVALNVGDEPLEIDLEDDRLDAIDPLATVGDVRTTGQTVTLGACSGLIARRRRSPARLARLREEQRSNVDRIDQRFRASVAAPETRPVRIDLSVTERCNLRCEHCINLSPLHTSQGTARVMSEAVLDCLREGFEHAQYVGFVHGGESLSAPIFWPVLEAIRDARRGASTTIHLLSNGMLLDAEAVSRFVELGGSSLMVSLDGATPASNDGIRVGGRLSVVLGNLRDAVRRRADNGWDLRLGLSCVVMRRNLGELEALMELAASIGLDWVKLEELVIKSPVAATERVSEERAIDAAAHAADRGRQLGLVVVDHVAPPPVWICRLGEDPAAARFLADDEYANRTRIHPCRASWEHACVDPNGDVHVADFWGAVVGNVTEHSLAELWSMPSARAQRELAISARPCGRDATGCPTR